jgi:hypothetical protein
VFLSEVAGPGFGVVQPSCVVNVPDGSRGVAGMLAAGLAGVASVGVAGAGAASGVAPVVGVRAPTCTGASATATVRAIAGRALAIARILAHLARLRASVRVAMHPARMLLLTIGLLLACGDPATGASETTSSTSSTGNDPNPTTTGATPTSTGASTGDATGSGSATSTTGTGTTAEPGTSEPTPEPTTTGPTTTTTVDTTTGPAVPVPLRALFINVGNASPQFGCFEYKLCRPQDVANVRDYIDTWQPDVIALSEVLRAGQLTDAVEGGPILPEGYAGVCGESRDRGTGELAAWDADDASHEHECVAWNTARVELVPGGTASVYGAEGCNYDFTGFRARLRLDGAHELAVVAVHPDSQEADCRTQEIAGYWSELAVGERVLIGGDWNSESDDELQRPRGFDIAYLRGQHWDIALHDDEYSAVYGFGLQKKKFDHAFTSFGVAVTDELSFGSALGGHDDHPRADGGDGLDHRQLLVDLAFVPDAP